MTDYKRGDIVLVDFGFSEGEGSKKRPALIISGEQYYKSRQEIIAVAITSNTQRILFGDTEITHWKEAGLIYPSVVTGIIRTIKTTLVLKKFGTLSKQDLQKAQENLQQIFEF